MVRGGAHGDVDEAAAADAADHRMPAAFQPNTRTGTSTYT